MQQVPNRSLFVDDIKGAQSRQLHYYMNRRVPLPLKQETLIPSRLNRYVKPITPKKKYISRAQHDLSMDEPRQKQKKRYPEESTYMYGGRTSTLDPIINNQGDRYQQLGNKYSMHEQYNQNNQDPYLRLRAQTQIQQYDNSEQTAFSQNNQTSPIIIQEDVKTIIPKIKQGQNEFTFNTQQKLMLDHLNNTRRKTKFDYDEELTQDLIDNPYVRPRIQPKIQPSIKTYDSYHNYRSLDGENQKYYPLHQFQNNIQAYPKTQSLELPQSVQFTFNSPTPNSKFQINTAQILLQPDIYDVASLVLPVLSNKNNMNKRFTPTFMSYANAEYGQT